MEHRVKRGRQRPPALAKQLLSSCAPEAVQMSARVLSSPMPTSRRAPAQRTVMQRTAGALQPRVQQWLLPKGEGGWASIMLKGHAPLLQPATGCGGAAQAGLLAPWTAGAAGLQGRPKSLPAPWTTGDGKTQPNSSMSTRAGCPARRKWRRREGEQRSRRKHCWGRVSRARAKHNTVTLDTVRNW